MKQLEANLFLEGLNLDTSPIAMSNQLLSYALNATMITKNGNEMVLQNDMGNGRVEQAHLPAGYVPVGMKEHGGIVYVASYNPLTNLSQIGSFPSPERNISLEEECGDKDLIFGYFSVNDEILLLTMKLLLTLDVIRPGDKFSIDMYNYQLLINLLKHIEAGCMLLDVAILNSTGGLVKLDYMNDLELSGVAKYTYEGIDTFIRYATKKVEEDIKYNVLKSKIIGELFLLLTLNIPEVIPYETTAYSYIVENVPISERNGNSGYFDILLPKYYTVENLEINESLKFITKYKIEVDDANIKELYKIPLDVITGNEGALIKATKLEGNSFYELPGGYYIRIFFTLKDIDTENIKSVTITPYFEDTLEVPNADLNSGWLPMLKRTISVNPAKVGKGEVYLSEFRYFNNIKDGYMTLNYSFESYLRKHEYIKDVSLILLPYEDILNSNYVAKDSTTYTKRPDSPSVGDSHYIKLPLKSNRKNYYGNFLEILFYEDLPTIKKTYSSYELEIQLHNNNLYKKSEGFCAFLPGQTYIGYIEIKTERYSKHNSSEIRLLRSKPLAIFTCSDINDLYFNSKLNTFIRGDISNTSFDDLIVIPSSLKVGFLPQHNSSIVNLEISNITYMDEGEIRPLLCYGDMLQTNYDPAALIRVTDYRLYKADYSLSVSPSYNVSDEFPIGVDTKVQFLNTPEHLKGQMTRSKATVNGNPLYYTFEVSRPTLDNPEATKTVVINTAELNKENKIDDFSLEVPEMSKVLDSTNNLKNNFAYLYWDETLKQTLLHIETFPLPSIYYGIALRLDDYYVDDISMLRAFNDNWEEGPLLGGCVYGDHSDKNAGRHYMAALWINLKAWRNDNNESEKSYDIIFADEYDATFWEAESNNHPYYRKCLGQYGSYWPGSDYKLALEEDGSYSHPEYAAEGTGAIAPDYKLDSNNRWKIAVDLITPKGLKYWRDIIPIIWFWQGSTERDGSLTPYSNIVLKLMNGDEVGDDQFSNFCVPILKDIHGNRYALNEWGYASLALENNESKNIIWKETYLDLLYKTFGYCFGRLDHITENILFKKVPDDEYDTYTNPYLCKIDLSLDANISITTTHYDNNLRIFNITYEDSPDMSLTKVTVTKISEVAFEMCDHAIVMPEIAISDINTDKVYVKGEEKTFTLPTLSYNSANFKLIASKFYNFEPGNYTLLKDKEEYHIFHNSNGNNELFNLNLVYFKGYSDNKYYGVNTKNPKEVVLGRTILQELKDDVLRYKRDSSTGYYGLQLGTAHKLLVGGKSNLGDNDSTYDSACSFGLVDSNLNYLNGHDDIGEAAANFSRISNMTYMSNARLLDDFELDPSKLCLHYLYDYRLKDTIPSIVYNISRATGNNYKIANNVARLRKLDLGDDNVYTDDLVRLDSTNNINSFEGHFEHSNDHDSSNLSTNMRSELTKSSTHFANRHR